MNSEEIRGLIEYFRTQGAPADQQMLIMLLREVQDAEEGVLSQNSLGEIMKAYNLKPAVLQALLRRIPALRCETVPHKLEICGTCRSGAALRSYIEDHYGVKSGGSSERAGFSYRVTGCMKNCKHGPSVRWDGVLYPRADIDLLQRLIESGND